MTTADDLLWGFNHALSNRLAAITSIARILEYSETGLDGLLSALTEEIATLEQTLDLLRLVPRTPHGEPEPVRLQDLLPDILRLHQLRGDARDLRFDLRVDGDAPPVLAEPGLLGHALLLALGAASRRALDSGGDGVLVRVEVRDEDVMTIFESRRPARPDAAMDPIEEADPGHTPLGSAAESEMIGRLIDAAQGGVGGGGVEAESTGLIQLRLPTLTLARRREREGSR